MTCDLSWITSTEDCEELFASSSEDELEEDELDASSLSESESGACWSSVPPGDCSHLLAEDQLELWAVPKTRVRGEVAKVSKMC